MAHAEDEVSAEEANDPEIKKLEEDSRLKTEEHSKQEGKLRDCRQQAEERVKGGARADDCAAEQGELSRRFALEKAAKSKLRSRRDFHRERAKKAYRPKGLR